jgi:hypothetical protein
MYYNLKHFIFFKEIAFLGGERRARKISNHTRKKKKKKNFFFVLEKLNKINANGIHRSWCFKHPKNIGCYT